MEPIPGACDISPRTLSFFDSTRYFGVRAKAVCFPTSASNTARVLVIVSPIPEPSAAEDKVKNAASSLGTVLFAKPDRSWKSRTSTP